MKKPPMVIAIIGFMGSGKSTLAKALSKDLNCSFYDLDQLVVGAADMSIANIFARYGEEYFRRLEQECLITLKDSLDGPAVIALGGGTPCIDRIWDILNQFKTIYLKLDATELASRLFAHQDERPLLNHPDPVELGKWIQRKLDQRASCYERADHTVHNNGDTKAALTSILDYLKN